MHTENAIRIFAGTLVLAGTLLGAFVSPWFLIVPGFVGANLLQFGFTDFCPLELILKRLGLRSCKERALDGKGKMA